MTNPYIQPPAETYASNSVGSVPRDAELNTDPPALFLATHASPRILSELQAHFPNNDTEHFDHLDKEAVEGHSSYLSSQKQMRELVDTLGGMTTLEGERRGALLRSLEDPGLDLDSALNQQLEAEDRLDLQRYPVTEQSPVLSLDPGNVIALIPKRAVTEDPESSWTSRGTGMAIINNPASHLQPLTGSKQHKDGSVSSTVIDLLT